MSRRPPRQRPSGVGGDTRARILDAAEELIAARGFDATSTAALADCANVPKGLVFYYFATKEKVLTTLIAERLPTDPLADPAALAVAGEPETALLNVDAAWNRDDSRSVRTIAWREADTHPAVRDHVRTLRTHLHQTTVEVLRASAPLTAPARVLDSCATAWVAVMTSVVRIDRLFDHGTRADDLRAVARVVTAGLGALSHP